MMKTMKLLFVPLLAMGVLACDDDTTEPEPQTVVDVAAEVNAQTGEFSTLIAALGAADLVTTLDGSGPFTVFAPTDAAFAAAGLNASNIGTVPVATLRDILLYHVAPVRRDAAAVTSASSLTMANGGTAAIVVNGTGAFIDGAQIVQTDVLADNGIIHVINALMTP